ncbi:MAG TPA: GNAT family N-acetyltransferase [Dehalococcoidia bacterium]|nr:GNAT family N-acetyltransferase [Dehalococcoidia bacterium]
MPSPGDIEYRLLAAAEVDRIDEIDRAEVIDGRYLLSDAALVLDAEHHFVARGWASGEPDGNKQRIRQCLARGGVAWGAFASDRPVGIAVLDGRRIGSDLATLDMYFLHVSDGYRHSGIGQALVTLVSERAREMGARRLYVSSTPSANSVRFNQRRGFELASEVDPELFGLEPDDIHMDTLL